MATVSEILAEKGSQVWTVGTEASVQQAANLMNEHRIGALVVLEEGRVVGMFTERDILQRVIGEYRDPIKSLVSDVMTGDVFCCQLETSIEEARTAMRNHRVRHLPVLDDDGQLLGLISIGDLNAHLAANQERTIYLLHEYLYGRV